MTPIALAQNVTETIYVLSREAEPDGEQYVVKVVRDKEGKPLDVPARSFARKDYLGYNILCREGTEILDKNKPQKELAGMVQRTGRIYFENGSGGRIEVCVELVNEEVHGSSPDDLEWAMQDESAMADAEARILMDGIHKWAEACITDEGARS